MLVAAVASTGALCVAGSAVIAVDGGGHSEPLGIAVTDFHFFLMYPDKAQVRPQCCVFLCALMMRFTMALPAHRQSLGSHWTLYGRLLSHGTSDGLSVFVMTR